MKKMMYLKFIIIAFITISLLNLGELTLGLISMIAMIISSIPILDDVTQIDLED